VQELKGAVEHITSERTQQLLLFQTSERYLSRVAAALQHKAGQEAKFRRCACNRSFHIEPRHIVSVRGTAWSSRPCQDFMITPFLYAVPKVHSALIPLHVTCSHVSSGKQRTRLASRLTQRPASSENVGRHSKRRPACNTCAPIWLQMPVSGISAVPAPGSSSLGGLGEGKYRKTDAPPSMPAAEN